MIRFLSAGESHGACLTAIIEGFPSGLALDVDEINAQLARRQRGYGRGKRMAIEQDRVQILSGVLYGKTTGAPITLRIDNKDWENWREKWVDGSLAKIHIPRPGHADWVGAEKYQLEDMRLVLERASARETAMRVAVGSVARQLLTVFGVQVGSYITAIGEVNASIPHLPLNALWQLAEADDLRCPDAAASAQMKTLIDQKQAAGDTLGGVFEVQASGVPVGLGSHVHWDRKLDARLSAAIMSIQAIKAVAIGAGFEAARMCGTAFNDAMLLDDAQQLYRSSNHAGGIEGGISNGEVIVIRAAMKPIPTTATPTPSVDFATHQAAPAPYHRSDTCAVPAAAVVAEAMTAWVLAEALVEKKGGDSILEMTR